MSSIWTVRRSATDAKLTGLCGGVAQHWGVDPMLVRVGWALLAMSGGIGVVLYVAGWLLIPAEGHEEARIQPFLGDRARSWSREIWIIIVTVCSITVFSIFGSLTPFGFGPAVILALIWYFGYYKNRSARPGPTQRAGPPSYGPSSIGQEYPDQAESYPQQSPPYPHQNPVFPGYPGGSTPLTPTPFAEAAETWRAKVEQNTLAARRISESPIESPDGGQRVTFSSRPPLPVPTDHEAAEQALFLSLPDPAGLYSDVSATPMAASKPTKRGQAPSAKRLRLVCVLLLGLSLAGLGVADTLGASIPMAAYFAVSLLVLGLILIAAAWFGRAGGILPVALLLVVPTLVTAAAGPVTETTNFQTRQQAYSQGSELAAGDRLAAGDLKVDLSRLSLSGPAGYTAHVGTGALEVSAPAEVNVKLNWRVGSGVFVLGTGGSEVNGGTDLHGTIDLRPPDPKKSTLTLNLSVDYGVLQVQ